MPRLVRAAFGGALLLGTLAATGFAQTSGGHSGHSGHADHGKAADSASTKAFRAANDAMHKGMDIEFSNDADIDFLRGMIPHHQGAIDMAKIVLEHGKDPQTRKLAQEIIEAQEKEIAQMQAWLKSKGK